jgi:hypothetical protein
MSYKNRRKERIQRLIDEAVGRIESDLLKEIGAPAIKLSMADLQKANPDQIAKIAQKTNINVVDQVTEALVDEPVGPTDASSATDLSNSDIESKTETSPVESSQQEEAVYNLNNWANQLQVPIGQGTDAPNGAIRFGYFSTEAQQMIAILVLSNGLIKMSGHTIQDFADFKNIVAFHKQS